MFNKIRRSLRDHKARPTADNPLEAEQHVCHACGQSLTHPVADDDEFVARPYELNEPRDRGSWNGSGFSDSGYGSSRSSQHFESLLQMDGIPPAKAVLPPARRSTYTTSIYSDDEELENTSQPEMSAGPAQMGTPEYDHLFDFAPRPFSKGPERWQRRSRYARLNDLPAASPGTHSFQHDEFSAMDEGMSQEEAEPEKKRRVIQSLESLVVRTSSFKRLASRRMRLG